MTEAEIKVLMLLIENVGVPALKSLIDKMGDQKLTFEEITELSEIKNPSEYF